MDVHLQTPRSADAISVDRLSVRFKPRGGGEVMAVREASFHVGVGEILCIVGPSGCGKSTALNAIAGLLASDEHHQVEVSGSINIFGGPLGPQDRRLGYMFQQDTLLPWRTALQNVELPLIFQHRKERRDLPTELLRMAGLANFAHRYPKELSGGMRKRIQLVQVLAHNPEILLMDEPFGALDAQTKTIMQNEFLHVWDRDRKTIVFVTHDLNEAILLGDRIICMTARPGGIKAEFHVGIERPRSTQTIVNDPAYASLFSSLWAALREEADRAMRSVASEPVAREP